MLVVVKQPEIRTAQTACGPLRTPSHVHCPRDYVVLRKVSAFDDTSSHRRRVVERLASYRQVTTEKDGEKTLRFAWIS